MDRGYTHFDGVVYRESISEDSSHLIGRVVPIMEMVDLYFYVLLLE